MSRVLPIESVPPKLAEIVSRMIAGEIIELTEGGQTVALITRTPRSSWPCQPGSAKPRSFHMASDFDAPLADFAEYM